MERSIQLAENLRYYRTKSGLTQKQLAERIGYTEKSVSKWESGNGLPTVEVVLLLAEVFQVTLDEFLFEQISGRYFLGIDGGGTKTVFRLTDENGAVIREVRKGPTNPNDIGMENAQVLLKEGINEVCQGVPYARITMYAGLSGGGLTGNNASLFRRFFSKFGFHGFDNGSDADNLVSLSDHDPCVLVVMGTGFIAYSLKGAERKRIAGWGQLFDEGGSGYTLGRDAITASLSAGDGSGKQTLLTALLENRCGEAVDAHVPKFYQGGKRYIASFADLVFTAAEQGDGVAWEILDKNMAFVAGKIQSAIQNVLDAALGPVPVLVAGGLSRQSRILFPLIEKHLHGANCQLIRLDKEPVEGALRHARRICEAET